MPPLLRLAARIDRLTRAIGQVAAWLALVMVLIGAYNAIARYVGRYFEMRLTSNALVEAQWYMFSLLFLFGAPWALQNGDHVRVDVFYGRLGKVGRARINLAGSLLLLLPFCVFAITTIGPSAWASFELREVSNDPGGLPRWPLKLGMPLAFALLFVQGVSEAIKSFYLLRGAELPELDGTGEQA